MNRREALAALVSLPATARITVADLKADDVLVLECDEAISFEVAQRMKADLEKIWPGRACLVLGRGLRLKVTKG